MKSPNSRYIVLSILLLSCFTRSNAQINKPATFYTFSRVTYKGVVCDSLTNKPLLGAVVTDVSIKDGQIVVNNAVTDQNGKFEYRVPISTQRRIEVSYLGYKLYTRNLSQAKEEIDLGIIKMQEDTQSIDEIVVRARMEMYRISGDTVLFFPRAVKTLKGDPVIEILKRMPGVKVTEGNEVYIDGKKVERTYINNRLIFGDDPTKPLITLHAKEAGLIQAYDEPDEVEKLKYGDDGRKRKVLNVVTFEDFKNMSAANVSLEGGIDGQKDGDGNHQFRYSANVDGGFYSEKLQAGITGDINNLNPVQGAIYGNKYQREGNGTVHVGYKIDTVSKVNMDYRYHGWNKRSESSTINTFFPTSQFKAQTSFSEQRSFNTRNENNLKLGYDYHKSKTILFVGLTGNIYETGYESSSNSETKRDGQIISRNQMKSNRDNQGKDLSINISLVQQLKKGTIQANTQSTYNNSDFTSVTNDHTRSEDLNRDRTLNTIGLRKKYYNNSSLSYQHLLWKGWLKVESKIRFSQEDNDKTVTDAKTGILDNLLSENLKSGETQWENSAGYQKKLGKYFINLKIAYSSGFINYTERIPSDQRIKKNFYAFLPSFSISNTQGDKSLSVSLSGLHCLPGASSLSTLIDDNNPLFVRTGNPSLKDSKTYFMRFRRSLRFKNSSTFSYGFVVDYNIDPVINYRIYFGQATVLPEFGDYRFMAGSTLTMPVNGNNNFRINPYVDYDINLHGIGSIVNFILEYNYSNPQDGVNNRLMRTQKHRGDAVISLSTNFSEKFRANISTKNTLDWFRNSEGFINRQYTGDCGVNVKWYMWERVFLESAYVA